MALPLLGRGLWFPNSGTSSHTYSGMLGMGLLRG